MKTKAAILYKLNSPLVIEDIEIPRLKPGQVLVQILTSGLCRSQLNEIKGLKGQDHYLPHLLGHEGAGHVLETGSQVKKVKKGDSVVLSWIKGSGFDILSTRYKGKNGIVNSGAIATLTEYAVNSENRLTKIPQDIPPDTAALLGCAVPTGAGIIRNTLKVRPKTTIAILGVGGIGGSAILAAKMMGSSKIIAVDISEEKCAWAKKLGATHTIIYSQNRLSTLIKRISKDGVDYAIEASGSKSAMESAFQIINNDGIAVIAGNISQVEKIALNPFDLIKGKRLMGTWGGETNPDVDMPFYVRAYRAGRLNLDRLITHRFKLEEINLALATLKSGHAGRIIVENF